jgi:hypothetical protein
VEIILVDNIEATEEPEAEILECWILWPRYISAIIEANSAL